jgi:HK97 family phage prohead protease
MPRTLNGFDCANPFDLGRMEVRRWSRERRLAEGQMPAEAPDSVEQVVTIRGYAAKYNVLSELMWDFRETILPGAFDGRLEDDVRALFNHDPNLILGRSIAGTLRLTLDDVGLFYEVDLPDTDTAEALACAIDRGDVTQSSFAFTVEEAAWIENEDGTWLREIRKISQLFDVSPVTYPAYPDATCDMRSRWVDEQRGLRQRETSSHRARRDADARARKLKIIGA